MVKDERLLPPPPPIKPITLRSRQASFEKVKDNNDKACPPPLPARPKQAFCESNTLSNSDSRSPNHYHLLIEPLAWSRTSRKGPALDNRLSINRSVRNAIVDINIVDDYLLALSTCTICCWAIRSGESLWNISTGLDSPTRMVSIGPDQVIVSTQSGNLLLISVRQGVLLKSMSVSGRAIKHLFLVREELWAIDEAGWIHFWTVKNFDISADYKSGVSKVLENAPIAHATSNGILWLGDERILEIHQRKNGDTTGLVLTGRFDFEADLGIKGVASLSGISSVNEGQTVVTAHQDGCLIIWKASSCIPVSILKASSQRISSLTSKGQYLWLGFTTGKIMIVDVLKWQIVCDWKPHQTAVINLNFSSFPNSNLYLPLASLCDSTSICIWDGNLINQHIEELVSERIKEYSDFSNLLVKVCSWNVDSQRPPDDEKFWEEWTGGSSSNQSIDIFVFGIQEMIDLESKSANAKLLISNNSKSGGSFYGPSEDARAQLWIEKISKELERTIPGVKLVSKSNMVGLMMVIYVRPKVFSRIRHVSWDLVKTGLGGLHGNKGSITTRMIIDDTSVCFSNCHLAAGHSQVSARNSDAGTILKTARFPQIASMSGTFLGGDGDSIFDHEHCIFFGDLNYRLNITRELAESIIQEGNYSDLNSYDQLRYQLENHFSHPLGQFKELPISFPPTYKYDRGSDRLDSSEKQRIPAYCDRILLRTFDENSHLLSYNSHQSMRISDHRPVSALLQLSIKKIDPVKREILCLYLKQKWLATTTTLEEGGEGR